MHISDLFWLFFVFSALQPVLRQQMMDFMRTRKIAQLERSRNSRVILLVHRQETMRFLGFPLARYIDINDSENVLRAIQMTDDDVPLDMVLHTPGGLVLAALQIAQAIRDHKSKVTVFVPHYAMSGGALIALAADEIVMCKHSVLGPIDPQLGDSPAASLHQGRRTEAGGGDRRSDLDPRGHRAEGDRSGQASSCGAAAAHAPSRSGGSAGGKARDRDMDARLSDLGQNGEGARPAGPHRHAERSPRAHVPLPAAGAHAKRRRRRVPAVPATEGSLKTGP